METARTKRYRVGIDGHVLDGKHQGSRTFIQGVVSGFAALGSSHELFVYCGDPERHARTNPSPQIHYRPLRSRTAIGRLGYELTAAMRRDAIDVSVFQYNVPALKQGKTINIVHDVLSFSHPQYFPWKFRLQTALLQGRSLRAADAIVTISEYSRRSIRERFPAATAPVHVVPCGPSFSTSELLEPKPDAGARPYILAVGRIEQRKNIDLLVRAFLRARCPHVDLLIVGSLDLGYRWRPPADSRVQLLSKIDDARLLELHRGAALFAFPSSAEGFGIPLLDAVLAGTPSIASNLTSISEAGGSLATYFDPEAADAERVLADRIAAHFNDAPIPRPSLAAREQQAERFSWLAAARAFTTVIESL